MHIYGIDPAPSNPTTVITSPDTGESPSRKIKAPEMVSFCDEIDKPALLCWDAPLTGPSFDQDGKLKEHKRMFSQRKIDSYFMSPKNGCDTPKGVSTRPYSGCSHWTISRACTGYPRVGPYDHASEEKLPFRLITENEPPEEGLSIVEVHPALALWIMAKSDPDLKVEDSLVYKGSGPSRAEKEKTRQKLCCGLQRFANSCEKAQIIVEAVANRDVPDPDELDALTAFVLGAMWTEKTEKVKLLGDYTTGTFLLPYDEEVFEGFTEFDF